LFWGRSEEQIVAKRTAFKLLMLCAFVLPAATLLTTEPETNHTLGYTELPNGRGGANVEGVAYTDAMGFDKARSLRAFQETLYPLLRANCSGCHSTENKTGSGAQAPLHADVDVKLAHEYALTRVNFRELAESKFVVRMAIDRHNCFAENCGVAANKMLEAVTAWRDRIADMIPEVPRSIPANTKVTEEQILAWIEADKAKTPAAEQEFIKYTSFHVLHNAGVSAQNLNHARSGLSKALNGSARWAPKIVNPVDVNGKGILYKFDIRNYWGYTLIDTSAPDFELFNTLSDDDIGFASKVDRNGRKPAPVFENFLHQQNKLKPEITRDDKFARLAWERVLRGNVEMAGGGESNPPNIDGFVGPRKIAGNKQQYVDPADLKYVEAAQLTYTLTRPDVYNAILAVPGYFWMFEQELGVDKSKGMDSYDYMVTQRAITIDGRFYYRAQTPNGYYWKTFDIFTSGDSDITKQYAAGKVTMPMWQQPIPKFIKEQGGTTPEDLTYVAMLPLGSYADGKYTGQAGGQASAEEVIWSLPNGLQAYAIFGAWAQRRVDAFTQIVRDPRLQRYVADKTNGNLTGTGRIGAVTDQRLGVASCAGCHTDGMKRSNNDLRDWLDEGGARIPKGNNGAGAWVNDPATVKRVRELYKPSSEMRPKTESDRRIFLDAMAKINQGMILGVDKNTYVEPIVWTTEWAQKYYKYPIARSN
jgi:mono/diheme cytochrome c family protein